MSEGIRHSEFSARIHDSGTNQPSSPNSDGVSAVHRSIKQSSATTKPLFSCSNVGAQACCRSAVFVSDGSATFKLHLMNSWEKLRVVAGNFTKSFRVGLSPGEITQSAVRKSVFEGFSVPPLFQPFCQPGCHLLITAAFGIALHLHQQHRRQVHRRWQQQDFTA